MPSSPCEEIINGDLPLVDAGFSLKRGVGNDFFVLLALFSARAALGNGTDDGEEQNEPANPKSDVMPPLRLFDSYLLQPIRGSLSKAQRISSSLSSACLTRIKCIETIDGGTCDLINIILTGIASSGAHHRAVRTPSIGGRGSIGRC